MFARIKTVAFNGIEAEDVDVQVHFATGQPGLSIVGLANKSVVEARDRIRSALSFMGLSLPPKRITINLAPADIQKDGNHYDLPIALGILICMGILDQSTIEKYVCLGELSLDGKLNYVSGVLPASIHALSRNLGMICPEESGSEAVCAGEELDVIAADSLMSLINFFAERQNIARPELVILSGESEVLNHQAFDMKDVRGQKTAKRALKIAAAGGHNVLMVGLPGSGKSMLAQRFITILPPLEIHEMLEVSMIASISGNLKKHKISNVRPFRSPHHSCSMPSMVGGGRFAKPGEISLAHNGVLFLDEFAEFPRQVLDSLRQPMEVGKISIARVDKHVTYPAKFQLIAAMNPCKCGYLGDTAKECSKVPFCGAEYKQKISGPILERIDIHLDVNPVVYIGNNKIDDIVEESSQQMLDEVVRVRKLQSARFENQNTLNRDMNGDQLQMFCKLDAESTEIIEKFVSRFNISMREYHKILRVSRTIADLDEVVDIKKNHLLEAFQYRSSIHVK